MIFKKAINELQHSGSLIREPQSFQDYISEFELGNARTAHYISIDSFNKLPPDLSNHGYMVLRLGSRDGDRNTHFTIVKVENDWNDFFLIDQDIFENIEPEKFKPTIEENSLLAFRIFPKLTEASLVNLALASGLMSKALSLDDTHQLIVPATGQSTFTFDFKPLKNIDQILTHNNGQVEIDALFTGERNGKRCLFLVEAKCGKKLDSIAKHKLFYPLLAVQEEAPESMDIVPVYVRVIKRKNFIEFNIAECEIPDNSGELGALTELTVSNASRYILDGYG